MENYKLSWLVLMPGMIQDLLIELKKEKINIKGIKAMGAMADLIPKIQITEITSILKTPYLNSFGSTETGMPPASAGFIPIGKVKFKLSKIQSSFCEIKLENENGKVAKAGEVGECLIKGPTLFSGYWNASNINKEDFRCGWFHMGDIMRKNLDGSIDFLDRAKYLIKSGGENIYPKEVELLLVQHPDIIDAVVMPIKHEIKGLAPAALVTLRSESNADEDSIKDFTIKYGPAYAHPRHVIITDKLPIGGTGKVDRQAAKLYIDNAIDLD